MIYHFVWFTLVGLAVDCVAIVLLVRSLAAGPPRITAVALALQATVSAVMLGEHYHESDSNTQYGMNAATALGHAEDLVHGHEPATRESVGSAQGGAVEFRDVSFSYPGATHPVLSGLDLTLRPGECTAIVGLNGAGKTTLVKLLARLYEPTGGAILVGDRKLRDLDLRRWRARLAVVFQDFNRYELPVRDNIRFGAVDAPAGDADLDRVVARAGLTEVVAALPAGLDTPLGREYEGGAELSGGQWQRVAIARALHAVDNGADVLILDEPTAALDVRSEAVFLQQLSRLTRGATTLLISHRLSSVRHADRIVVLDGGRIVEDGSHETLLRQDGRYASLFRLQAASFDADAGKPGR
jgi:ATP-binding cassette subfamily B protein